jgi:plasmid stability protein
MAMSQLVVRGIEEKLVRKLKQRAGERGVSMEEEHRRILREALEGAPKPTLKEYLLMMPELDLDEVLARRKKDFGRKIEL